MDSNFFCIFLSFYKFLRILEVNQKLKIGRHLNRLVGQIWPKATTLAAGGLLRAVGQKAKVGLDAYPNH
jgi:hypothetical protein